MGLGVWLYEVTQLAAISRVEGSGRPQPGVVVSLGEILSFVGRWNQLGCVVREAGLAGTWCGVR